MLKNKESEEVARYEHGKTGPGYISEILFACILSEGWQAEYEDLYEEKYLHSWSPKEWSEWKKLYREATKEELELIKRGFMVALHLLK